MSHLRKHQSVFIALGLILAAAFFLRAWQMSLYGLWTDEFATYWCSMAPDLGSCISRTALTQGQSPLYFILERFILLLLPASEWSVRALSLISSLGCVYLAYVLGLKFFRNTGTALTCAWIMALNVSMIYYSQEARPYALAIALAMLAQFFFMKYLAKQTNRFLALYCLFAILSCYCHYFMGPLLIAQNLYCLYLIFLRKKLKVAFLIRWLTCQLIIALSFVFLLGQILPMLKNRSKWQWLRDYSFTESAELFLDMFDFNAMFLVLPLLLVLLLFFKRNWKNVLFAHRDSVVMLVLWWVSPFLFCFMMTKALGVSLIAQRYFVLALIPFILLIGKLLTLFHNASIAKGLVVVFTASYLYFTLLPPLRSQATFSYRIPHDWRGAIRFIDKHFRDGDVIFLRSGFVKENWLPQTTNKAVISYAKSPFYSFYWSGNKEALPVFNMTYTMEPEFHSYYDHIIDKELASGKRIWIIGVNPPNTNFPVRNMATFVKNKLKLQDEFEKDFYGVYLALLVRPEPAHL